MKEVYKIVRLLDRIRLVSWMIGGTATVFYPRGEMVRPNGGKLWAYDELTEYVALKTRWVATEVWLCDCGDFEPAFFSCPVTLFHDTDTYDEIEVSRRNTIQLSEFIKFWGVEGYKKTTANLRDYVPTHSSHVVVCDWLRLKERVQ